MARKNKNVVHLVGPLYVHHLWAKWFRLRNHKKGQH